MTFITTDLIDGGVLVEGTDCKGVDGTTVLRSELWTLVKARRTQKVAQSEFDEEVEQFFKPLTDAAKKFEQHIDDDDDTVVVLTEGVERHYGVPVEKVRLDSDGVVLKILEEGDHDRLRWVGGHLVAIKA